MSVVSKVAFVDYQSSIAKSLDLVDAPGQLPSDGLIILKPNLTNSSRPPVTTDVRAVESVYLYCREHTSARIVIAEGCGSGTTEEVFDKLGYTDLAGQYGIELIDLNEADSVVVRDDRALQIRQFHIPRIVPGAFVISIPVLKDHSFTRTTVSMKNMFGIAPGRFYRGSWNKSRLHSPSTHKSVFDICLYKKPDLSIVDASVALSGMHLAGTPRPLGLILAGFDCVAVDAEASRLLGHEPDEIEYLKLADGVLGDMNAVEFRNG